MKKLYLLIAIIVIAAILRFVILPSFSMSMSGQCLANPELNLLLNGTELVVVGTADTKEVVNTDKMTYTDTSIGNLTIIRGTFDNNELTARQAGGCNIITGICVQFSESTALQQSNKYLLFLRQYPEDNKNVYEGFSACGGAYQLSSDPVLQSRQIEAARNAITNMDEQKWQEFAAMLKE